MTQIPTGTKFIGISSDYPTTERKSALINSYSDVYTIEDFRQTEIDDDGNVIVANSSNNTVDVPFGGQHFISNFSGMVLVNDHNDGSVELWLCGGGSVPVLVSRTDYGPGPGEMNIAGSYDGYVWENVNNQVGPFTFTVIKTRLGS